MLNTEKIAVMTKAAINEGKEGLQDDRVISYFETDYLLKGLFGSLITYTVAFFVIFALYAAYHFEDLVLLLYSDALTPFLWSALRIYLTCLVPFLLVTFLIYLVRYHQTREKVSSYRRMLETLADGNEEEKA